MSNDDQVQKLEKDNRILEHKLGRMERTLKNIEGEEGEKLLRLFHDICAEVS